MDFEEDYTVRGGLYPQSQYDNLAINTFVWDNVSEDAGVSFAVVQIGYRLFFHSQENAALSSALAGYVDVGTGRTAVFSFAAIDGDLIVAKGTHNLYRVSYDGTAFSVNTFQLKVRDLWGVQAIQDGRDLYEDGRVSLRPATMEDPHLYNLRNQGWGVPRAVKGEGIEPKDTLNLSFTQNTYGKYPSNADIMHEWVRPDPESDTQKSAFFAKDYQTETPFNTEAPRGYFIIDAMKRGTSRANKYQDNMNKHPQLVNDLSGSLLEDTTLGGATTVAEYAGRIFYAGFSGSIQDGDDHSPRLASYVLFSQLVDSPSDLPKCYQSGDPTSPDESDLVATDGGFIRVSGAEQIIELVNIGRSLFVIATNGIWMISGGVDSGFSADNFEVEKLAAHGPTSSTSLVAVEDTFFYWGDDGIYHATPNEFGTWGVSSISHQTIQSYYTEIPVASKATCKGEYDLYNRKIRWLYELGTPVNGVPLMAELIYDLNLQAWHPFSIGNKVTGRCPRVVAYMPSRPFDTVSVENPVVDSGSAGVVDSTGAEIIFTENVIHTTTSIPTMKYLTVWFGDGDPSSILQYTFSDYNDVGWRDWATIEGDGGIDAPGKMTAGTVVAGDSSRDKQMPYLTFHMEKSYNTTPGGLPGLPPPSVEGCEPYACDAFRVELQNAENFWPAESSYANGSSPTGHYMPSGIDGAEDIPVHIGSGSPDPHPVNPDGCYNSWRRYDGAWGTTGARLYKNKFTTQSLSYSKNMGLLYQDAGGAPNGVDRSILSKGFAYERDTGISVGSTLAGLSITGQATALDRPLKLGVNSSQSGQDTLVVDWATIQGGLSPDDDHWLEIDVNYTWTSGPGWYNESVSLTASVNGEEIGTVSVSSSGGSGPYTWVVYETEEAYLGGQSVDGWANNLYLNHPNADALMKAWARNSADYEVPAYCYLIPGVGADPGSGIDETDYNQSSCLVTSKWDYTHSGDSGRWSRQFQVYRETRHQDTGHSVITTRNKVRGRGGSFFMTMDTEPNKDCRIVGWNLAVNGSAIV